MKDILPVSRDGPAGEIMMEKKLTENEKEEKMNYFNSSTMD